MARARQSAPPVAVWLVLALARLSDGCPKRDGPVTVTTCTQRIECRGDSGEGLFLLGANAHVTSDCRWIVDGSKVFYLKAASPFNLTEQGGCSALLQIAPADTLARGDMEDACSRSRLKSNSLFVATSQLAMLPTRRLLEQSLQQLRNTFSTLTFRAVDAIDLCRQPQLVVNGTTYVKTPYAAVSLPCNTALVAQSGWLLNVTVVDAWPSEADVAASIAPGCVCYELRGSGELGRSACWSSGNEPTVYSRHIEVTVRAAAAAALTDSSGALACTIVLRVDVTYLPTEQVTTPAATQEGVTIPGQMPNRWPLFIISTSVTFVGGIILIGGLAMVILLCRRCRPSGKTRASHDIQRRRLPAIPTDAAADEPIYHELDDFTYGGHLTRPIPSVKEGSQAVSSFPTNDYDEIRPLNRS